MMRIYYRGAHAAIVCYDLTNVESWSRLQFWIDELRKNESECLLYMVGTKRTSVFVGSSLYRCRGAACVLAVFVPKRCRCKDGSLIAGWVVRNMNVECCGGLHLDQCLGWTAAGCSGLGGGRSFLASDSFGEGARLCDECQCTLHGNFVENGRARRPVVSGRCRGLCQVGQICSAQSTGGRSADDCRPG